MGQKDISEKLLEDYNDVFADIINVLLFQGERRIKEEELSASDTHSQYKADCRSLHEQERDVLKFWHNAAVRLAWIGLENQTTYDKYMPVRLISYDGAAYRSQLLKCCGTAETENNSRHKDNEENKTDVMTQESTGNSSDTKNIENRKDTGGTEKFHLCPVITIVLNFSDKRWGKVRSLYDCLDIPEELKPFVNDYKIQVFDISYLTPEQINLFQSDFYHLADYSRQMRVNRDYKPSDKTIRHVDALLKMFTALTGDNRYEEAFNDWNKWNKTEGGQTMCEFLDRIVAEGEARGKAIGESIGEARGKVIGETIGEARGEARGKAIGKILVYQEYGVPLEEIARKLNLSVEEVEEIIKEKQTTV